MAAEQRSNNATSLAVRQDQPLIGIVLIEDGQEVTRYFTDEAEADAMVATRTGADVRDLAATVEPADGSSMVAN